MREQPNDSTDPTTERFAESFANLALTTASRAPLYSALAAGVARQPELSSLLGHAPSTQQQPVLLLACVHHLVLDERSVALAEWYPNLTPTPRRPTDPELIPTFAEFVHDRRPAIAALLAERSTQTNEVGRCASFLPALGCIESEVGPLGHLDVGASGGLNLLLDRYRYEYGTETSSEVIEVGDASPVVIPCSYRGDLPVPAAIPSITARIGIDRSPIDVTDPVEARWLEACVWPDQADRFHRLSAAIELAQQHPPVIRAGDAVDLVATGIAEVGVPGHPVVTNSWVLNYFTPEQRIAYLSELDRIGAERDLTWIFAEAPALVPELPCEPDPKDAHNTVLTIVRWRHGTRSAATVATCHPHGYWIHWR